MDFVVDAIFGGLAVGMFLICCATPIVILLAAINKCIEICEKKDKATYDVDTAVMRLEGHKRKSGKLTSTMVTHNRAIDDAIEIVKGACDGQSIT